MCSSRSRILAAFFAIVLGPPIFAQWTQRVSVDSAETEGNNPSTFGTISADGGFVAFVSLANNLVPGDTNSTTDVFVRDLLAGTTERVNISSLSAEGNGPSGESLGSETKVVGISADGRYVMFPSRATNLVAGDANAVSDVFVRDRQSGTTERVSVDSSGTEANERSYSSWISNDGRYVVFVSLATNLVAGDTNGASDIFVRDRQNLTTERVSIDSGGVQGNGNSVFGSISADGRYVAFMSNASNLVAGDTNGVYDVFVRDRQLASTQRVSLDSGNAQGNAYSSFPMISADGHYVAFTSAASNLVAGDTNGVEDVFVRDRQTGGLTTRVSVDSAGAQSNGAVSLLYCPSISFDGRYVAFDSAATNLVAGDTNAAQDVFLRDRLGGTSVRVSLDSDGTEGNGASQDPTISADGRRLAFWGSASNLVQGDANATLDVFFHDEGAGGTEQESGGTGGGPSNNDSTVPSISADDRFVAFESVATNLVAGDTNGSKDIFVRDREAATTTRVSISTGGAEGNGVSAHPSTSADGRYVAFDSIATNLVAGDTNGTSDVFVRDLQTNTTTRVSIDSGGTQANGNSFRPSISSDGRYVAFDSVGTNLVAGDTNAVSDVFVRDLQTNTTTRVSIASGGTQGNGASTDPSFAGNGSAVAFESTATNLVTGDSNGVMDVFMREIGTSTTTRMSVDSSGVQGNASSANPSCSTDGRYVAFDSGSTNLVAGDTNVSTDVFVRDRQANATDRVSVDSNGTQGLGNSSDPSMSSDGRSVAFGSDSSNLVAGDTNLSVDVFVRDRQFNATDRVSVDTDGTQGLGSSSGPSITADGRDVAFQSSAPNLTPGDTNSAIDVFVRDHGVASAFEAFCFGDGSGTPCPCGNSGSPGHGCQNSSTTGGAILTVTGEASLSDDTVQFTSSNEKPTALSIFLQGSTAIPAANYGDGLRCAGGTLKRLFNKSAVGGVVVAPVSGDPSVSARSAALSAPIPLGSTRIYQVYYRDPSVSFCPSGSTFNVSSAIAVAWGS